MELKTTTVPVVMGALGTIKKGMESYFTLLFQCQINLALLNYLGTLNLKKVNIDYQDLGKIWSNLSSL